MKLLLIAAAALSVLCAPAWAVNKCTGADGSTVFQDKPCPGQGETVGEELARREKQRKLMLAQQEQQAKVRAAIQAQSPKGSADALPGEVSEDGSGSGYVGRGGYGHRYRSARRGRR